MLDHVVPPAALPQGAVPRSALVGVLAVPERLGEFQREMDSIGERSLVSRGGQLANAFVEPADYGCVVRRGVGKRLSGQTKPRGVVQ